MIFWIKFFEGFFCAFLNVLQFRTRFYYKVRTHVEYAPILLAYAAEADITGKNLFTGNPIARAKTNNALNLPSVPRLGSAQSFGALDLDF